MATLRWAVVHRVPAGRVNLAIPRLIVSGVPAANSYAGPSRNRASRPSTKRPATPGR